MMTRYRLWFDFLLQTLLLAVWALLSWLHPERWLPYALFFVGLLLAWQILHAWYVVHKHRDWHRRLYLLRLRRLLGYGLLTVGIGSLVGLLSFGLLWSFGRFVGEVVALGLGIGALALALQAFGWSIRCLYRYAYRPRSFWDL